MNSLVNFFTSRLIWAVASAWFLTQGVKVVVTFFQESKWRWHRFIEPGGMPSSHAAMVIALLTGVGIKEGILSTLFAVTLIFSLAIIYEAIGVRKKVEQQAQILNQIIGRLSQNEVKKDFRETLGHKPLDVVVGSIIGFLTTWLWLKVNI
jgi:hypothetical protein